MLDFVSVAIIAFTTGCMGFLSGWAFGWVRGYRKAMLRAWLAQGSG